MGCISGRPEGIDLEEKGLKGNDQIIVLGFESGLN